MNQITHWLDSSNVYGSGNSDARNLRSFRGGRLRSERGLNGAEMLPDNGENDCKGNSRRCFLAGDKNLNMIYTLIKVIRSFFVKMV